MTPLIVHALSHGRCTWHGSLAIVTASVVSLALQGCNPAEVELPKHISWAAGLLNDKNGTKTKVAGLLKDAADATKTKAAGLLHDATNVTKAREAAIKAVRSADTVLDDGLDGTNSTDDNGAEMQWGSNFPFSSVAEEKIHWVTESCETIANTPALHCILWMWLPTYR